MKSYGRTLYFILIKAKMEILEKILQEISMNYEQEQHLKEILDTFAMECSRKYRTGQKEHGGNLFDMSAVNLIENVICEAIDLYVYAYTLREKLREQSFTERKS